MNSVDSAMQRLGRLLAVDVPTTIPHLVGNGIDVESLWIIRDERQQQGIWLGE